MGVTLDNIRFMVYDAKYSWWFRFWALLWFVGFILSFVALGVLGRRADIAGREKDFHTWFENVSSLAFPRFHFRIADDSIGIGYLSYVCYRNGQQVGTGNCEAWEGQVPQNCFAVKAEGLSITNVWGENHGDARIDCHINTTTHDMTTQDDYLIAWELEGPNHAAGGNSLASMWVAPNNEAWILLRNDKVTLDGVTLNDWERTLVYQTSVSTPGIYRITTILTSFMVGHIEQADSYPGWRALGDIGGFAFFMVLLSTLFMIAFGFCFTNNSKFLGGEAL